MKFKLFKVLYIIIIIGILIRTCVFTFMVGNVCEPSCYREAFCHVTSLASPDFMLLLKGKWLPIFHTAELI